ncbi:MAG: pyridoxal-phosphate dependent enzyme, partial [Betaproteobacteria bacterium]|nr:pyridoxal-phosphate dependent enzyme [Betaproteobacteria bacterium]
MTRADITRSDIDSAISRLDKGWRHFLRETPLWQLSGQSMGVDCAQVWLKLEHQQVGGSFKARGMLNRMLAQPIPAAGVVIASGGNAGIAAASAAQALGVPCEVFVSAVSS